VGNSIARQVSNGRGECCVAVMPTSSSTCSGSILQTHELVAVAFDALSSHIAVLDAEGKILLVNAAWRCFAIQNGGSDQQAFVGTNYLEACRHSVVAGDVLANEALQRN
jgi:hypothetical protein